jgi:imidazole glycerol-phosphate synthase subunit HisH
MIGVVEYEAGNIQSVSNALGTIGAEHLVTSDRKELSKCDGIILPGVGAAPGAMAALKRRDLTGFLKDVRLPFLGICLGMQLLYEYSEEGGTECLGVLPGTVRRFDPAVVTKVPHMGWNDVEWTGPTGLRSGEETGDFYYFAHSYYSEIGEWTTGVSSDGIRFTAAICRANFLGVQFHPEKSGDKGLKLLRRFISLCASSHQ